MAFEDSRKIGTGLVALGVFFLFIGVILFFDSGLLAIGDILFLSGITMMIGFNYTFKFFKRRDRIAGTVVFFLGIVLVFIGWPIIGMILQGFGFINLFAPFFPMLIKTLSATPIIGDIMNLPIISSLTNRMAQKARPPV
uniref:Vesicle transport protein n=1 Tax=Fibrocapsa japonica TaxID=94617 RepID=A0A7S2Y0Z8_9STRA|mmetsp:Transcript_7815/g.11899  ORF Transcript_7815/g.11899 Transcript_7815/m.11899 type:complete len:139 (+) Transcript_7815:83-499(+)